MGWGQYWRYDIGIRGVEALSLEKRMYKGWSSIRGIDCMQSSCQTCIYLKERGVLHCTKRIRQQSMEYIPLFNLLPTLISFLVSTSCQLGIRLSINLISASSKPRPDSQTNPDTYPRPKRRQDQKKLRKKDKQQFHQTPTTSIPTKRTASSSPDSSPSRRPAG